VQTLDPLAVQRIAFGPAGGVPGLPRVDEVDLKATPFEQFEQRHPVDARRLHGDGVDAADAQPIGQRLEVGGASAEGADMGSQGRVGVDEASRHGIRRYGDKMDRRMDINAGGTWIGNAQGLGWDGNATFLVVARGHGGLQNQGW
jgi:hypothetical protein